MADEIAGLPIVPLVVAGVGAIVFVSLIGGGGRRSSYGGADVTLESMRITSDALKELGRQGVENAAIQADLAKSRSSDKTSITLATIQSAENLAVNERQTNTDRYRVFQESQNLQSQLRYEFRTTQKWFQLEKIREAAQTLRARITGGYEQDSENKRLALERQRLANERYAISQGASYESRSLDGQLGLAQQQQQQSFLLSLLGSVPGLFDLFRSGAQGLTNMFGGYGYDPGYSTRIQFAPLEAYGPGYSQSSDAIQGALGGAASGAALGTSIYPGIGTAVGAAAGAAAGGSGGLS